MIKTYAKYKEEVLKDERSKKLNFNADGRTHYVYRVTDLLLDEYYYGSRTASKDDLFEDFKKYRTSSLRKIINEDEVYTRYALKIIKVFDNPGDKIVYESFLHQRFNVKLHIKFWNGSNQTPFKFDTTGISSKPLYGVDNGMYGKTHSEETREKIKKAREKQGSNVWNVGLKGSYSAEYIEKIAASVRGRKYLFHPETRHVTMARPEKNR